MDQQVRMRQSYEGFATHISTAARQVNATWPMFRIPYYELHAAKVRMQSGSEIIGCAYLIQPNVEDEYLKFVDANYEDSLTERHMTRYGNLDHLQPTGYTPTFHVIGPNGSLPDTLDRPLRAAAWQISPREFHWYHNLC